MNFIIDKQTLNDLNLLGRFNKDSIFVLFNQTKTNGGARLLENMFSQPMNDQKAINERSRIFSLFQEKRLQFPLDKEEFSKVEHYLSQFSTGNYISRLSGILALKLKQILLHDDQFTLFQNDLKATLNTICRMRDFIFPDHLLFSKEDHGRGLYEQKITLLKGILNNPALSGMEQIPEKTDLSMLTLTKYHHLFMHVLRSEMQQLLEIIYELDVWISVSNVAREKEFKYANALPAETGHFSIKGLRHPAMPAAIPNTLMLDKDHNFIFLTGANMAGKSTLMKSLGIAVYLAHMGFPIAAQSLAFSVKDGIYTSINVADNLTQGLSHFYAEVLRIKKVAEEVSTGKKLFVIFDELFKGTNVKDAYDATLAVSNGFAAYKKCCFMISTHITEVGEELIKSNEHLRFVYLPTVMEQGVPRYTYQLQQGISTDRQGMIIIRNEKILEMLNE